MDLISDYFHDKTAFDTQDGAYKPIIPAPTNSSPLAIPPLLSPDKVTNDTTYCTIRAQQGTVQYFPDTPATNTWGYNGNILGPTIPFQVGVHYKITLVNDLPEPTTWHWHGLNISGPIADGGPFAAVLPGEQSTIEFTLNQPAATAWLHPHPCPQTARQVWQGLAAEVIIQDTVEAQIDLPRAYGTNDIPLVLQDRSFHNGQLDYDADYDVDGTTGNYALVNGTLNATYTVTQPVMRFRILNGANRREFRLNFSDGLPFYQIASDGGLLPQTVGFTRLMLTCAERAEILVDFRGYQPGDQVQLRTDDSTLITFNIGRMPASDYVIPDKLAPVEHLDDSSNHVDHRTVMSGMDAEVRLDDKLFDMTRIDYRLPINTTQCWEIENTNDMTGGMVHPYHMHGCEFQVVSRNGNAPFANEHGWKDTVAVNPGEVVKIKFRVRQSGLYMYHCHILEHEDTGMMAQYESFDPNNDQPIDITHYVHQLEKNGLHVCRDMSGMDHSGMDMNM
ncbi:copper oxidase [Periweissella cryptocerci]|uniref:Copper oxidase n=1 Tax=Periweissella cryptocerci TaxID=2506420 RepID=A0A4P6YVA1_9LACO|nr:multicopper oxidase domain-containing protein [Periweissella cryptocerci]QBO36673.1 copper oxidase [Periweissella cryptocerci]